MKRYFLLLGVVVMVGPFRPTFGQSSVPTMHIEKFMTAQEMQVTGVAKLTSAQREALDQWLTKYTLRVMDLARESKFGSATSASSSGSYGGVGSGHWISSNDSDGAIITLEDGSMWQINPVDQVDTGLWLPITDVTVIRAKSPVGDYRYELINTEDNETALAKYLGVQ
jgi:hypothetical protein